MRNQWTNDLEKLKHQRDGLLSVLKRYESDVFGGRNGTAQYLIDRDLILQTRMVVAAVEKDK